MKLTRGRDGQPWGLFVHSIGIFRGQRSFVLTFPFQDWSTEARKESLPQSLSHTRASGAKQDPGNICQGNWVMPKPMKSQNL